MSQAFTVITQDRSAFDRVMLSRDLLTLITADLGADEAALGLEGEILRTTPNTRTDEALQLLIAASWLEASLDGGKWERWPAVALATIRQLATAMAAGKLPKRVLEYYGAV